MPLLQFKVAIPEFGAVGRVIQGKPEDAVHGGIFLRSEFQQPRIESFNLGVTERLNIPERTLIILRLNQTVLREK